MVETFPVKSLEEGGHQFLKRFRSFLQVYIFWETCLYQETSQTGLIFLLYVIYLLSRVSWKCSCLYQETSQTGLIFLLYFTIKTLLEMSKMILVLHTILLYLRKFSSWKLHINGSN